MSEDRDTSGRFVKGVKPGPGRPLGARNKLGTAFLEALQADFQEHGAIAIAQCRESKPEKYIAVCASLLPKEVDLAMAIDIESKVEIRDFVADYRLVLEAARGIGAKPITLEATDSDE
jgi:hypothetical protein